jgi:HPt (histidine-containing phosphotransfer) domain-containing protein
MTAGARQEDKDHCVAVGMDSYLVKPVNKDALLATLARFVPIAADGDSVAPLDQPPGPDSTAVASVLDSEVVGRLDRLGEAAGEDLIGQLAVLFLVDADSQIQILRRAVAGGDAAAVVQSAHSFKGASTNLGATDLARLCAALEAGGVACDLGGAGALIDAVEAELGLVNSALGALARRHNPAPTI